jgi:hypothetical protein
MSVERKSLEETQQAVMELVQEDSVFATARLVKGRRVFVSFDHATEEDRKFTVAWLESPHFGLNS